MGFCVEKGFVFGLLFFCYYFEIVNNFEKEV